eukprot:TRINITY_DN4589_c0_g2_i1.p1 TRINITY_DN4589_c0_g2~~TRINITY_DN4589_c0_g2_i1.p1  ORF type:complete len:1033 (+),score=298.16 TRINITY_DN4589_c0_g2_i1:60-3158(+)
MAMVWHIKCLALLLLLSVNHAAAGKTCASNPLCSQLGLTGNCCPANSGANLDCCGSGTTALEAAPPKEEGSSLYQPPEVVQPWGHRQCLLWNGDGCESIRDEEVCKNSRDGRAWEMVNGREVRGSPCVWCNGEQCQKNHPNLCSSYGWLRPALGQDLDVQLNKGEKQIAHCTATQTTAETLAQVKEPSQTPNADMTFTPMDGGENRACRGSYLADTGYQAAIPRFGAGKSYTTWTASSLEECKAFCSNNCKGVEYHAAEQYCAIWHADVNYAVEMKGSECLKANKTGESESSFTAAEPTEAEMSCLKPWQGGCHSIEQKINCLSSKDGSDIDQILGLKVKGQACVWCEGGPCTSNSNSQCEPYDYLKNGEGRAFSILHGRQRMDVASCFSDATNLGAAPDEEDTTCLKPANAGCNTIVDEAICLASRDNRSIASIAGLRVQGEPCVWCGGGPCSTGNANLCEPYQFAVYGERHAFNTFLAKGNYKVAACENGAVEAHSLTPESIAASSGSVAAAGASKDAGPTSEQQAAAGEAAAPSTTVDFKAAESAGAAAAASAKNAGMTPELQAAAAGAAAQSAAALHGMSGEQQAAAAGAAAAAAAASDNQAGPASAVEDLSASPENPDVTPQQQAEFAGKAAAAAAAAAAMPPPEQAEAAGSAAATAAQMTDMSETETAAVAADAAAAAGQAALVLPDEQAAFAGAAAAAAGSEAGMPVQKDIAVAGEAASISAADDKLPPKDQAAAAGAAAASAAQEEGLPAEQQASAAGAAAASAAKAANMTPKEQVQAAGEAEAKEKEAEAELVVEQKKDGTEALDTVAGNGNELVQGEEAKSGGWPWWATVLIVCVAVLLCTIIACCCNKKGKKEKKDGKRSAETKKKALDQGDDVELQAPLVEAFSRFDKDGDGMISRAEWEQAKAAQSVQAPQFTPVQPVPQVVSVAGRSVAAPQLYSTAVPVAAPATASINPSLATQGAMVARPGAPAANPSALFDQIDLNHNGTIDRREWATHQQFTALDRNHDGVISPGEWQQAGRPM